MTAIWLLIMSRGINLKSGLLIGGCVYPGSSNTEVGAMGKLADREILFLVNTEDWGLVQALG
jgi:hypothetical protein